MEWKEELEQDEFSLEINKGNTKTPKMPNLYSRDTEIRSVTTIMAGLLDLLISMLLVSRFRLMEQNAAEVYHHYEVHLSSTFLM